MNDQAVIDRSAIARLHRIGGHTLVSSVITSYLDNGPERIAAVVDGGAAGDMARVERAAHTLKSSAGNVGAVRLGRACAALEEQAHGGIAASDLVQRVLQEYEHTVTELSRILEEMDP